MRKKGLKKLRIWSAGCSTGEEPYTLSMILHEVLKTEISSWDIKITANDTEADLKQPARDGITSPSSDHPGNNRQVFRQKEIYAMYGVQPKLKTIINFAPINPFRTG